MIKEKKENNRFGILGESVTTLFKKFRSDKMVRILTFVIGLALVGIFAAAIVGTFIFLGFPKTKSGPYVKDREKSKFVPRRLDGVLVERERANKFPYAVMIENLSTVRPQKGISLAGVVYETLAEGGITRFLAVFSGEEVKEIWPVRSARHYYLEWSSEYNALYVHVGGSPQAYEMISQFKIPVLNEISSDAIYFWRGLEGMPHNLYTSSELLEKAIADKKYEERMPPKYQSWKFKDEKKIDQRPEDEKFIKIGFFGDYAVEFKYDHQSNTYLRFNGGVSHKDRLTDKQLVPKNVVVQKVPNERLFNDEKDRIELDVTGEGQVFVFRDGEVIEGKWRKKDRLSRTKFFDKNDREISLNRGQTWVVVVPGERSVEFK